MSLRHDGRGLTLLALLALAAPLPAQDRSTSGTTTTITGTVYDSLGRRPLPSAVVQIVSPSAPSHAYSTRTDSAGAFRIAGVPPGRYVAGFFHPVLDSLGLNAPTRPIELAADSLASINLAIPSGVTIHRQLCPAGDPSDSSGLALGVVHDADSGIPLGGSRVVLMWTELEIGHGIRRVRRQIPVQANAEGWYAICGIPSDAPVEARAELGRRTSGYIELAVPPRSLAHRDFAIPTESAAVVLPDTTRSLAEPIRRGTARLTGIVRSAQGKPLAGAHVVLWGSTATGITADNGSFTLIDLPAGTQTVEARYVGYAPKHVTVDLRSGETTTVTITLDERVDVLNAVTVYGKAGRSQSHDITGFLERQQRGFGHFITRADIERQRPFETTDLLRMVPGVRVVPTGPFTHAVLMREGCRPSVYIDGMAAMDPRDSTDLDDLNTLIAPEMIAGMEVYNGIAETPAQFRRAGDTCGAIVIWTGVVAHN